MVKEFYGESAYKHGLQDYNKKDGVLMAQNVDWRNSNSKAIDTDSPLKT